MDLEAIRRKIMENMQQTQVPTAEEQAAIDRANKTDMVAGLGKGIISALGADAVGRGAPAPNVSGFDQMRADAQNAIKMAVENRKNQGKQTMDAGMLELATAKDQSMLDRQGQNDQNQLAQQALDNQYRQDKFAQDAQQFQTNQAGNREDRALQRQQQADYRGQMQQEKQTANEAKIATDLRERLVPGVGVALTVQDAKDLKNATDLKQKFDSQLTEMIDLRKQYGGEVMNREAVARGKQLSNDLLLTYKDLAKLGVLSTKDTQILNSIIPSDPLAFSLIPGQDPILSNLEKFKQDAASDYGNKLKTRLTPGQQSPQQQLPQDNIKVIGGVSYKQLPNGDWEEQ